MANLKNQEYSRNGKKMIFVFKGKVKDLLTALAILKDNL